MLDEFKSFILRGNVVDLAVGIIIGAAFTSIVDSLVKDVLMPPLGLLLGGIDFSNFFLTLKGDSFPTLDAAQKAGAVTINYGVFTNAVIKFLIVGFAVFLLIKNVNALMSRVAKEKTAAAPAAPPKHEVQLAEIRDILTQK